MIEVGDTYITLCEYVPVTNKSSFCFSSYVMSCTTLQKCSIVGLEGSHVASPGVVKEGKEKK